MLYIVGVKIKPLSKIRADLSLCVHLTRLLLHMMVNLFSWTQDAITHTTVMELLIDEN